MKSDADVFVLQEAERAELLTSLLRREGLTPPSPLSPRLLTVQPRGGALPLSYAQERLWFLEQLGLVGSAYNVTAALRLEGALDINALQRSFTEVVRRHEALRTRLEVVDGAAVQAIDAPSSFRLEVIDLGELGAEERTTEVGRLTREHAQQRFDLARDVLLRAMLLRLEAEDHVMLVNMHHVVSDAWSTGILIREIGALYAAFRQHRPSPLGKLPIQYADYAIWQRDWLRGEALAQQIRYWSERLAGAPAALELPTDRPRPTVQSFAGSLVEFALPDKLSSRLSELSRRAGATLYMVLLAAFKVLLQRYSGRGDVVVGSPIAGRRRQELEGLIGFFVNTLVMRTDLSGDPTFDEILRRVKETCLDAYSHQDLPFEKLVEELQPVRDLSRQPVFQVMFALQNMPETLEVPGLRLSRAGGLATTSRVDLTLFVHETPAGLRGHVEYATDLFEPATIERLVGHYRMLLEGIVADPSRRLSQLPLLTDAERRQLLEEWNDTAAEYPQDKCLHELLAAQAARTPDAVALVYEDRQLSYGELDAESNRLAHHLRGLGVGPEVVVGLCVERSLEMVIALLGILKAGGAYLPLDPGYPPDRLAYMLADARAGVLLTQATLREQLGAHDARVVLLDAEWDAIAANPTTPPINLILPDNLAYVIYTSGSTGKPKGAMNVHRAIVNRLQWMQGAYSLTSADRILQKTPFSFDVSVWEFFWPLMFGARLVIARPEGHQDPSYLSEVIEREGVTIVHFVPSMLHTFLETADLGRCASLRDIICSGEALAVDTQNNLLRQLPSRLHNLYGPTEAAIDVSVWQCEASAHSTQVPIGHPINNIALYVLDAFLSPVPVGVSGELYIGGVGLARGYLGRADLTADRFMPSPFGEGERLYRTGDLARWRADGELEYLGRIDHQVKVRGYRIELGEIEAALTAHADVAQAVVMAREDVPGEKRLIAYVVDSDGAAPDAATLRSHLKRSLPDYMVPSAFVVLDGLPLTPNGKVDRRALPAPEGRPDVGTYVAPRTPQEEALCGIWREVLKLDRVGVTDNFFELGGHSLLAMRMIAQLREVFEIELPLRAMFEAPTIGELAVRIAEVASGQTNRPGLTFAKLSTITPDLEARYEPFPLNDIQEAYWIGRGEGFILGNVAAYGYSEFESVGLNVQVLNAAWQRLIERHDMLRAVVLPDGSQRILAQVPAYQFPIHDLQQMPPDVVERELLATRKRLSHQVLPTDRWPLFTIEASLLPHERVRFHFGIDIIICDAWSRVIMLRELALLYRDLDAALPPLALSFRDYVEAERALKDSELYRKAWDYWSSRFNEMPPAPALPLATKPERITQPRFRQLRGRLDRSGWQRIKAYAAKIGLTPTAVLLSIYADLLALFTGESRFTLNLTVFNRLPMHPQIDDIVGDFTSLLPLVVEGGEPASFLVRCRSIQQQLWADLDHRLMSGVRIARERARGAGAQRGGMLPVVFTSTLGMTATEDDEQLDSLVEPVISINQTPQVWLDLQIAEAAGELFHAWGYVDGLFPEGMIDVLFDAFCSELNSLAEAESNWSRQRLVGLPQAQLEQRRRANATDRPIADVRLEDLFLAQVEARPDAPAVIAADRIISYRELERYSLAIAKRVMEADGASPRMVGVVMEKGWEQVVAVLGVLRAGKAYVPLDPALPTERLQDLLADCGIGTVLTQSRCEDKVIWPTDITRIAVDRERPATRNQKLDVPPGSPDGLAYVIHTSGSTGRPKGVMISHRGAVNTIIDVNEKCSVSEHDRLLSVSSLSFDLSVYDIFGTLAAGAAIVLPEPSLHPEPSRWVDVIVKHQVTLWNSVPALLELMLEQAEVSPVLLKLRLAMLSGDWIALTLPERLRRTANDARLLAMGGATEASIWSNYKWVDRVDPQWASIPYGRPLANQQFHVLNKFLQPCPVWTPGELYIGGVGLALGYWGDDERTRESFVVHPDTKERLYRTGDLGRYLPDGEIEFLGRQDAQVKISGYRIELGEIEHALLQHPSLSGCAVTAWGEKHGQKRLLAYAVPKLGHTVAVEDIRQFLRQKLPNYMVPNQIIPLERLPLTSNGKIDRRALPAPEMANHDATGEGATTQTQQAVLKIWTEVLRAERIGIHDDFFQSGGDSLLAMRVAARIRETFKFTISTAAMFEYPTVAELARFLDLGTGRRAEAVQGAFGTLSAKMPAINIIMDPGERERFKAKELGLRLSLESDGFVNLAGGRLNSERVDIDSVRRNSRHFAREKVLFESFSSVLNVLKRHTINGTRKYGYPSAGGLYPVQTYVHVREIGDEFGIDGVPGGAYYYSPAKDGLYAITPGAQLNRTVHGLLNRPVSDQASFTFFLIAEAQAIVPIYGMEGLRMACLEAGMMSQAMDEAAHANDIGICHVGGVAFDSCKSIFDLGESHLLLHVMMGGRLVPYSSEDDWSFVDEVRPNAAIGSEWEECVI